MKKILTALMTFFLFSAVSLFFPQLATPYDTDPLANDPFGDCGECHSSGDLHPVHSPASCVDDNCPSCTDCHQLHAGNGMNFLMPQPAICSVCHPRPEGNEDTCNLVDVHGSVSDDCIACHGCACPDITTTTTVPVEHENEGLVNESLCLTCHDSGCAINPPANTLHGDHSAVDCMECHVGTKARGTVNADKCVNCHHPSPEDMCNLVGDPSHVSSCIVCHSSDCPDISTTSSVPVEHESGGKVNETLCLSCHEMGSPGGAAAGTLHGEHSAVDCMECHEGTKARGTVNADKCVNCHHPDPENMCDLIAVPSHVSGCISCHSTACPDISTTTSVPVDHENGGKVNEALCLPCHTMGDPGGPAAGTLHAEHSAVDCMACHVGTKARGTVNADKCVACHPSGNEGMCNLAAKHGSDCLGCHSYDCTDITTTTSVPKGHGSNGAVNEHVCLRCHELPDNISPYDAPAGTLHGDHSNCDQCHVGGKRRGTVNADRCAECHPAENPGECGLANLHGDSCLICHSDCVEGTTTTSAPSDHWESGAVNETVCLLCHDLGSTFTSKAGTIHGDHGACDQCHVGLPAKGTVAADTCIVCHPSDEPGKCGLTTMHRSTCLTCHSDCADETTTTSVPGNHGGGGEVNETLCLICHELGAVFNAKNDTLHGTHGKCTQCHEGVPARGEVYVDTCIGCHPAGDPGKCGLVNLHGSSCTSCHFDCEDQNTTTIPSEHSSTGAVNETLCLPCHTVGSIINLQDGTIHGDHSSDCNKCHEGGRNKGTVSADKCIVCHPLGSPGKCSLASNHGSSCLNCHFDCDDGAVTTTTTTIDRPAPQTLVVEPGVLVRSRWIMLPALIFISGEGTDFVLFTSNPAYDPITAVFPLPALILGPELMVQPIAVNPAWLAGTTEGIQKVTVTVDGEIGSFEINMLAEPFDRLNNYISKR